MWSWFRRTSDGRRADEAPQAPPITPEQRDTIDLIVSVMLTGALPDPDAYSRVKRVADGRGLVFGAFDADARDGALASVIEDFYDRGGMLTIKDGTVPLSDVLPIVARSARVTDGLVSLDVLALETALGRAGSDPLMRAAQRAVHDRRHWEPTYATAQKLGLRRPLTYLALYLLGLQCGSPLASRPLDSGALARLRPAVESQAADAAQPDERRLPPCRGGGERVWAVAIVEVWRQWLLSSRSEERRAFATRCDLLLEMMRYDTRRSKRANEKLWNLERPFTLRGVRIA